MNEEETDGEYLLHLWSSFPFVWFPATASRRAACAGERERARERECERGRGRRGRRALRGCSRFPFFRILRYIQEVVAHNFFPWVSMDLNVEASAAHKRTFMDFLDPDVSSSVIFLAPLVFVSATFMGGSLDLTLAFACI